MRRRFLGLLLCAAMVCGFILQGIAVASASAEDGLCIHHTEHTAGCGYSEGVGGKPCGYDCPICSELELRSAAFSAGMDAQALNHDTVAVILNSDGTPDYKKQFATLQDAIWAVPPRGTAIIKIVKDITLSKGVSILTERHITLISDGEHTITAAQTAFSITNSVQYPGLSSLTIGTADDTENKLTVKAGNGTTQLIYCDNSNFTLNSGVLDGSMREVRGVNLNSGSKFVMKGGKIENCLSTKNGGAVVVNSGSTFEMYDGTISKCKANLGGAVYVNKGSGFVMRGGLITQCTAASNGGGIYLGKDEKASFVMDGGVITECTTEYGGGGVYMGEGSSFTMSKGTISSCTSNQGGGIYMKGGAASFVMDGGVITECNARYGGSGVYMGDNNAFTMNGGSISNCGWIEGATSSGDGGGIYVKGEKSSVTMNGGTISHCSAPGHYGGGIYANGATVTMKGTISGCEAKFGGGVSSTGKIEMVGGAIKNCEAVTKGGGIYLAEKTAALKMDNAVISGCEAGDGGGIHLAAGAKLSLNKSIISGCKAISYESDNATWGSGGGVYLSASTAFTMKDSDIQDNTAGYLGGGIYIAGDGTYILTSGNISGNKIVDQYGYGGGIYVHKGATLNLTNVVITKNTATALGGGIWSCRTGDIKIYINNGGAVFDNSAEDNGNMKTPEQAGDDIASTVTFPAAGFLQLSHHMLGGGANRYYVDGGITGFDAPDGRSPGVGLGAPDGKTARYDEATSTLVTETYITKAIALKNVVSETAKAAANGDAKLIISGNFASRGGGIGTNGNLVIGTPDPDSGTGNLTVKKEVAGDERETGKEFSIQVTLKKEDGTVADITGEYGEMIFRKGIAIVTLKAGQSITATGLPTGISYTVEEAAESQDGYTVTYTHQAGTIGKDVTVMVTVTNTKNLKVPQTGDNTNTGLWLALACCSLFGIAVGLLGGKRHGKTRG